MMKEILFPLVSIIICRIEPKYYPQSQRVRQELSNTKEEKVASDKREDLIT